MNIQQLKYVLSVSNKGGFGKAAESCFVTQSTLSTMVARFEHEIGITIFNRNSKPVTITEEGKILIAQIKKVQIELDALHERIESLKGNTSGTIRLGIIPTVAPYLLPHLIHGVTRQLPEIDLAIREQTTEKIMADLRSRDLDIGILSIPLYQKDLKEYLLYPEPFLLFDMESKNETRATPSSIDMRRLWLLEEGHCLRNQARAICDLRPNRKNPWNVQYESGSVDTLLRFVRKHNGITLLPYLAAKELPQSDQRHIRIFEAPVPVRNIGLVVHQHFVKDRISKIIRDEIEQISTRLIPQNTGSNHTIDPF